MKSAIMLGMTVLSLLMGPVQIFSSEAELSSPPDSLTLDSMTDLFEPVEFDHLLHSEYAACSECHHHTTGLAATNPVCLPCHDSRTVQKSQSCRSCHLNTATQLLPSTSAAGHRYHIDIPNLKGAYHLNCIECHRAVGSGPTICGDCHVPTAKGKRFFREDLSAAE